MDPSYSLGISRVCFGPAKATSLLPLLGHIINPLMSNLVRLTLSDIGLVPFCVSIDRDVTPKIPAAREKNLWYPGYRDVLSVHKNAERTWPEYPAFLSEQARY